jgi:hypothetical protein
MAEVRLWVDGTLGSNNVGQPALKLRGPRPAEIHLCRYLPSVNSTVSDRSSSSLTLRARRQVGLTCCALHELALSADKLPVGHHAKWSTPSHAYRDQVDFRDYLSLEHFEEASTEAVP